MAKRAPHRITDAVAVVWTLIRVIKGEREILGQYSSEAKGLAQVERLIASEAKVKQIRDLPPWLSREGGVKELIYGRDAKSWWFRLEPYAVDSEAT